MNERMLAQPTSCRNADEMRQLLKSFGPYAGRYLMAYPVNWRSLVLEHFSQAKPLEQERVKALLRRAKEDVQVIASGAMHYHEGKGWLENALTLLKALPPMARAAVVAPPAPEGEPLVHTIDSLDLPPTADERVDATPGEIARVCRVLLSASREVFFVDPYLNPRREYHWDVLVPLLKIAAAANCRKVVIWARHSLVVDVRYSEGDVTRALAEARIASALPGACTLEMILVCDESSNDKMHGRYMLSVKGGVRIDQGFQRLPKGRKVDVSPVGAGLLVSLLSVYKDGQHDMKVVKHLTG